MSVEGAHGDFDQPHGEPLANGLSLSNRQSNRATRYRISVDLMESETDFMVLTDAGELAFRIDGKAIDHDTIRIEELDGRLLFEAPAHAAHKVGSLTILDANRTPAGKVHRHNVSPLRDRFAIELADGTLYSVDGAVATQEYSIYGPLGRIADISQRWFRARGSYGVEIAPDQQDALLLICVIAMDQMVQRGN